jgi:hypothetical protein
MVAGCFQMISSIFSDTINILDTSLRASLASKTDLTEAKNDLNRSIVVSISVACVVQLSAVAMFWMRSNYQR